MEHVTCELSSQKFDAAVHGGLDDLPVLKEGCDVAFFVKPKATEQGNAAVAITFTVQLPDGTLARAQTVVTAGLLLTVGTCIQGWKQGGQL